MKNSYNVDKTFNDMRIDRWIRHNVKKIPQSLIEKSLRNGKIKLNHKKVKSLHKVKTNDRIDVYNLELKDFVKEKINKFNPSKDVIKSNEELIIDNNDDFIVLNKSSGISVQGGTKSKKNLIDIFTKSEIFGNTKPFSVHRLDKDTSGVFIMAKHRKSAQLLTSLFRLRRVHKTYLAVCHGELEINSGTWKNNLVRYENNKPIIEHIIEKFTAAGVDEFVLTVNYKAQIMKAFFEELNPDYSVDFLEEKEPLGTAGSLKFLEGKYNESILVTNCDIIIKTNYIDLYEFHQKNNYDITLVASMKNYTIPYGTCELNGEGHLKQINEKPEFDFLVNTGLYALNPDVLRLIPEGKMYHITQLIDDAKKGGMQVGVYPIDDDSWIDVGQWAEYKKAVEQL